MDRIKIREAVIVEGKYDKIRLSSLIDGLIITTDGFGIFKKKDKIKLLRTLARERGLLILTDSDGAGFVIRNYISGCVDPSLVKHAYIPQLMGKERRKAAPSKEGTLGVEGMPTETLVEVLRRAGVDTDGCAGNDNGETGPAVTRGRLFDDGFIGGKDSAAKRRLLLRELGLPEYLSSSAMLKVINITADPARYERAAERVNSILGGEAAVSGELEED